MAILLLILAVVWYLNLPNDPQPRATNPTSLDQLADGADMFVRFIGRCLFWGVIAFGFVLVAHSGK